MSSNSYKVLNNEVNSNVSTNNDDKTPYFSNNDDKTPYFSNNDDFNNFSNNDGQYNPFKHILYLYTKWNVSSSGSDPYIPDDRNIYLEGLSKLSKLHEDGGFQNIKTCYQDFFRFFQDHEVLKTNSPIDLLLICGDFSDEVAQYPRYERLFPLKSGVPSYYAAAIVILEKLLGRKVPAWIGWYCVYLLSLVS